MQKLSCDNHIDSDECAYIAPDGSSGKKYFRGTFFPIPELQRPAADVSLAFLSANDVPFSQQSDDSWYSAHLPITDTFTMHNVTTNMTLYYRDDPVRVLGCTSRYQYCNPNLEPNISCTPLTGIFAVQPLAESLWKTEQQGAMFNWSSSTILHNAIGLIEVLSKLGTSSLTARHKWADGKQGPIPDNQWQLDVEHWFTTILADLQRAAVDVVTGPLDRNFTKGLRRPQKPEERLLCDSQV